ncbi:hypothetical protein B0T22DRAFT_152657 [Podospora appendiculata]|uniref:Uncharacterized protein n=1 Tax=Podospora appendiculata TaxID=314037 RepID=A0AAE0X9M4_9PEZI|nr:hypothetical protein B0T22DRAFT_152657 [Podospora appendiculata]
MKLLTLHAALGSASVLFAGRPATATHGHRKAHELLAKRHGHSHTSELVGINLDAPKVMKRSSCSLPDHPDLVHVPGDVNNGFAMSPNEPCTDGKYCPFACVPGKVMAQWQPHSSYIYPQSMNGGLYCNNGKPEKPFPDRPYCVDGTGAVKAVNTCGKVVSFCQTVLPGNEAMIIPTDVSSDVTLAVPGISYWDSTAAHYYINAPGVGSSEGCVWGDPSQPIGNWSPYVAGANTDANGQTFVKIAWNPIYTDSDWATKKPTFGLKIECPGGGCNGLPCSINPTEGGVGALKSPVSTVGVGGASFCVVTVPKGQAAHIVVFNTDGSEGEVSSAQPSSSAAPTTSTTSSTTSSTTTTSTTSSILTTSSTTSKTSTTTSEASSSSVISSSIESSTSSGFNGGIFHENSTKTSTESSYSTTEPAVLSFATQSEAAAPVATTSKNEGAADKGGAAIAGLVVALFAAATFY